MKILIPITKFGRQGGFRVLSELANNWILNGNDVTFLVFRNSPLPYFPTNAKILWYDRYGNISLNNDLNYSNPSLRVFHILFALYKTINKLEADIILATMSLCALPVAFVKNKGKKFYYIQAYEPDYYSPNSFFGFILKILSKLSYEFNLIRIVNSPLYFNYRNIKADKFVFPGIDFGVFKPNDFVNNNNNNVVKLGCIGRIEPYKGTSYVVEAYKLLKSKYQNKIELYIAFGNLESHSSKDGIIVETPMNDKELASFYNKVDILIAPGTIQLGAVHYPVIEAMACKTTVITTNYLPASGENSWLVPIKDSKAIFSAVIEIVENPELNEKKILKAYQDVKEFDWKIVSQKMLDYFAE